MKRLAATVVTCLVLTGVALANLPAVLARDKTHVMAIAHRKDGFFAPENTLR